MRVASEKSLPVTTRGSGYGYVGGCVPAIGGVVLGTQRMNRIKEIDNADFVAVVEPGVITGELQSAVRREGLFTLPIRRVCSTAALAETLRRTRAVRDA